KYDNGIASYGLNKSSQNDLLDRMNTFISSMRVHGKTSLLPFQKGIIVNNTSLKKLFIDMEETYGPSFIVTRKLNQDVLENLFSFLKGMVGSANNNMTVFDFKYCLRWYILGKHSDVVFTENTNTENDNEINLLDETQCLTGQIINELQLSVAHFNNSDDTSTVETIHLDTGEQPFQILEEGCAQYVSGYVANRFYNKYPSLTAPHNSQPPDNWTNHLSRGSLKIPSDNLFKAVLQLERDFKTFHGDTLSKKPQVFKNLYKLVAPKIQHLNIPDEVILCLIRTRTYIRLNNLNNEKLSTHLKKQEKIKKQKFTN
ncbi:Uncharacterized protein FWK35_00021375, partial [Aphis craccivora]